MGSLRYTVTYRRVLLLLVIVLIPFATSAQESLNEYYAYPLSVGGGYAPLSAVGEVLRRATVNEFAGKVRVPMPFSPALQPFVAFGIESFDSDELDEPTVLGGVLNEGATMPSYNAQDVWDHRNFFGALGAGYAQRVSKEFEVGAEAFFGLSQSYFDRRVITADGTWYPVGSLGMIAGGNGKLTLNASYNFSVDLAPTVRYERSFGGLRDFDGIYFGVGFAAHYRFGQDPDAPQAEVRALRIGQIQMPPVFAAMQSVYVEEPLTTVTITNIEDDEITDLEVTFNQPEVMDSPTPVARIDSLASGEAIDVPITAAFNRQVFFTNGITPYSSELTVRYSLQGRPVTQSQSATFDLHDRNALTWDDDRKVCAFITPSDSAVGNFASFIRTTARDDATDYLPDALEAAMQVYHALASLGLLYQPDPTAPFAEVQGDTLVVDSVSLPRETLINITGDCDDITVLYNTVMEAAGFQTGIVTIPGHIYSAVNTGVSSREYARVHPDRSMTINEDRSLWILVEITMIGREGFIDAWRTGMEEWHAYDEQVEARNFHPTAAAQQVYRPVGLQETDLGLQYKEFLRPYRSDLSRLASLIVAPLRERAEESDSARHWNHVGVIAARLQQYPVARSAFEQAASRAPRDVGPKLNIGSLAFIQKEYDDALGAFQEAEQLLNEAQDEANPQAKLTVFINIAKTLYALEQFDQAGEYVARAEEIDPEEAGRYDFIAAAAASDEGARAAAAQTGPAILFWEDEE